MRRSLALLALASCLSLAVRANAAERASINRRTGLYEPPVSDLRKAAERGDRAELSRAATRLGPARLRHLLGDGDRKTVLAALEAAPLLDAAVLLLDPMLALLASPDAGVRARAVLAIAATFARADPLRLAEYEVPSEVLSAACRGLATLAGQESEPLATRLSAIQGTVDGGAGCAGQLGIAALLASHDAEVRRAAIWAVPTPADAKTLAMTQAMLSAATKDSDGGVAGAAAARLCRLPAAKSTLGRPLHDVVRAAGVLPEDIVELLPCLSTSPDPADQKALTELAESGRGPVREAIKRMRETHAVSAVAESPARK